MKRKAIGMSIKNICILFIFLILVICGNLNVVYADSCVENSNFDEKINGRFIDGIENIALIVVDNKLSKNQECNEVIICTFDNIHGKVKLTSILRDTYVNMPNGGTTSMGIINDERSIRYIMDTLNNNFSLNISSYAKVDLTKLLTIVASIECIPVDIKKEEIQYLKDEGILNEGIHRLTPNQAVAFTRIPGKGIGNRERGDRVRIVLSRCFEVVKKQSVREYLPLIYRLISCIESNITSNNMVKIGINVLTTVKAQLEEQRYPLDNM